MNTERLARKKKTPKESKVQYAHHLLEKTGLTLKFESNKKIICFTIIQIMKEKKIPRAKVTQNLTKMQKDN